MAFDLGKFVGMAAPTASLPHRDPRGRNTTLSILYADGPEGAARGFRRAHRPGRRAAGLAGLGARRCVFVIVPCRAGRSTKCLFRPNEGACVERR